MKSLSRRVFGGAVVFGDGCWLWRGWRNSEGYGRVRVPGQSGVALAHRVSYETLVGPIPEGKQLDHLCRNTACIRPSHLEPVTSRENTMRGRNQVAVLARQTHCKRGHALKGGNLRLTRTGRSCRRCNNEARAAAKRAAKTPRSAHEPTR
jgi:hypothetical protein